MPISPTCQTSSTHSTTSFQYVVKYSCEEGHTVTGLVDGSGAFERRYECGADLQPEGWVRGEVLPLTHIHLVHLIKCVKETQAGSYKACYLVPLFGDNLSAAQKSFTVISVHINNNYAKKRGIGKKLL